MAEADSIRKLVDAAKDGNLSELNRLISENINVNGMTRMGETALHAAIRSNQPMIVKRLLEVPGINVNKQNWGGEFPLTVAIEKENLEILNQLLEVPGINVNSANADTDYETPFYVAAGTGNLTIVNRLLEVPGINVNKKNVYGESPIMFAAFRNHINIVKRLLEVPGIETSGVFDTAAEKGFTEIMRSLRDTAAPAANLDVIKFSFEKKLYNVVKDSNRAEFNSLFQTYAELFPELFPFTPIAELAATYDFTFKPMMSQRGATCASDSIFTILFESEFLRPLFYAPDWASMTPASFSNDDLCIRLPTGLSHFPGKAAGLRTQYLTALSAAKTRYDRMVGRGNYSKLNTGSRNRRALSIENTLWESTYYPVKTYTTREIGGMSKEDVLDFFEFVLPLNGLQLPTLRSKNPFKVSLYNVSKPPPSTMDPSKIIAIIMLSHKPHTSYGHWIGFYRNGETWFLVDDEVGYIHQIMDTEWFNNIFLPRLKYTLSSKQDLASVLKEVDKKVYLIYDKNAYKPLFLENQFITMGDRFYPNVNPAKSTTTTLSFQKPIEGIFITMDDAALAPTRGATGGGSAVAASATRKGRRSVRKSQTRRARRRVSRTT